MGFDPVTLTLGMMAAGGAVKAAGDIFGGISQSNMYKYQSAYAQRQAAMETQNAAYARSIGEIKAQRVGLQGAQDIGKAKATQAASGFRVDTPGSNQDVVASIRQRGQQDESITRANAAREAFGYDVKATEDTAKAGMYGTAAKTAMYSGFIGAGSSVLGSATSVSDKWILFDRAGMLA